MRVQPVVDGGVYCKIGPNKRGMKKHMPAVMVVRPVLSPSAIPAPDSMNAVTGDDPINYPIEMEMASVQYARVDRGKEPVLTSTTPAKRAIEYSVPVQSR